MRGVLAFAGIIFIIVVLAISAPTINKCYDRGGWIHKSFCYVPNDDGWVDVIPIWEL